MNEAFLKLQDLKVHFPLHKSFLKKKTSESVKAVNGVNLEVNKGEILGLVGESGCGKTTLARAIMQLTPATSGNIRLEGRELCELSAKDLRQARHDFQMIFQDPYASLNPRMTVFDILKEAVYTRKKIRGRALVAHISQTMKAVGLNPRFLKKYPHEFSGGQRQRIAIARALACEPKLIIADEPVSALDVSIQSQIINLLKELTSKMQLTLLFIGHDLSVMKYICDRIAVMYLGKIVEIGQAEDVIERPYHPYTKALISAIPIADPDKATNRHIIELDGDPPSPISPPSGCTFHPRCKYANENCTKEIPSLELYKQHEVACSRVKEIETESSS